MRRIAAIFLIIAALWGISGCEAKSLETATEQIKPVMPYEERVYVYNNGLDIEYKDIKETDESDAEVNLHYPVISGLKNKSVEERLNKEIPSVLYSMINRLKEKFPENTGDIGEYAEIYANATVNYSCNNVLFIEYNASIYMPYTREKFVPIYSFQAAGYDLNTGNSISLKDIFKPGVDYIKKINTYISQYIIENNYDDYEYEIMTGPFRGIREDQGYSLSFDNLVVIIDEKNEDFVYYGYPGSIYIPLKYLGDDLYIFDRYFDENINIFESSKLTKKLFPNKIDFKPTGMISEGDGKWHISIMKGEFMNIPDKTVERELNAMLAPEIDPQQFRREAEEYLQNNKTAKYYGELMHNIEVLFNNGGYLSVASVSEAYTTGKIKQYRKTFNYDFNRNRKMHVKDLFINDVDVTAVVKKHVASMGYTYSEKMIEEAVNAALDSEEFSFSEHYVLLHLSPMGANNDPYREWIWIGFEEFGLENISLFN
jgi:hypothetical protein